jgi:hypothetical protein
LDERLEDEEEGAGESEEAEEEGDVEVEEEDEDDVGDSDEDEDDDESTDPALSPDDVDAADLPSSPSAPDACSAGVGSPARSPSGETFFSSPSLLLGGLSHGLSFRLRLEEANDREEETSEPAVANEGIGRAEEECWRASVADRERRVRETRRDDLGIMIVEGSAGGLRALLTNGVAVSERIGEAERRREW